MHTASEEWAAQVAARNEIETAKQMRVKPAASEQLSFDWTGGGEAIKLLPLSAEGADGKAVK